MRSNQPRVRIPLARVLRLNPARGAHLDLATGAGWTSRRRQAQAKVTGADVLATCSAPRASGPRPRPRHRISDQRCRTSFADGQFDAIISTCGIMFITRQELAAAEIARVTCKGGRVALTTWLSDSNLFKMFMVMKPICRRQSAPPSPFEWGGRSASGNCWGLRSAASRREPCSI
jgi:SAM-dependent methyltransferase